MKKQTQNVGQLALVVLSFSLALSGCERLNAAIADGRAFIKAIKADEQKTEKTAEADKAETAKAAVRELLEKVDVLCGDINKSSADLSLIAQEVKPLFEKVAQAAPKPTIPTSFVGLVAVVVPAETKGGEPQIFPIYLVNNQALAELDHQALVVARDLTKNQAKHWKQARSLLLEQLDQLIYLVRELWAQNPDSAKVERPVGFLAHVVEMHIDNEERGKVCAAALAKGVKEEPVPAWFDQVSTLGLTPAAKKLLAE